MTGSSLRIRVEPRRDAVLVAARGHVDDVRSLHRLLGPAVAVAGRRPALIDVCDLYLYRRDGARALRSLVAERAAGARTVVLARTGTKRRMPGLCSADTAWYPAELRSPLVGLAASLAHRRRHLPPALRNRSPVEDPLGELLWSAARERSRPLVGPLSLASVLAGAVADRVVPGSVPGFGGELPGGDDPRYDPEYDLR